MTTLEIIQAAKKSLGGVMESSARLNLEKAIEFYNAGNFPAADSRAIRSLSYSIGVFSPIYHQANRAWEERTILRDY